MTNKCFLDTNFLIYFTDHTSSFYSKSAKILQDFEKKDIKLYLSHEVIEEFIFVINRFSRLSKEDPYKNIEIALAKLALIPNLTVITPPDNLNFANNVLEIMKEYKLPPNDSYILSIVLEHQITSMVTFDKKLISAAKKLHIKTLS